MSRIEYSFKQQLKFELTGEPAPTALDKLSDELVINLAKAHDRELEKQLTDIITCGHGTVEQSSFQNRTKYTPYRVFNSECKS